MSSGITWIDDTREAVDRASNVVQAQAESDALEEAEGDLQTALRDLSQLRTSADLGQGTWWLGHEASPVLWSELRSAQRDLRPRQLRSAIRELTTYRTRLREMIKVAWREHIASQAGDAVDVRELVRLLTGAAELADIARSLDEALGGLAQLQTKLPDQRAVQALAEAVRLLDALETRLPAAVKTFVAAASRGGAALDMLDNEVRTWLVNMGVVNNFRVVPGRPGEVRRA